MKVSNIKKSSIQPAVKMDKLLFNVMTDWLKTDQAKELGFHSKSHLVTQAVRDLMFKYRTLKCMNIVKHSNYFSMVDLFMDTIVTVGININEHALECQTCYSHNEYKCDHVYTIWNNPNLALELLELKLLNPFIVGFSVVPQTTLNTK